LKCARKVSYEYRILGSLSTLFQGQLKLYQSLYTRQWQHPHHRQKHRHLLEYCRRYLLYFYTDGDEYIVIISYFHLGSMEYSNVTSSVPQKNGLVRKIGNFESKSNILVEDIDYLTSLLL
jgi:hypothetical protein